MKSLIAVLMFCISIPAWAENWMKLSDIQAGSVRGYGLKKECIADGARCVQVDGYDLEVCDVVNGLLVVNASKQAVKDARLALEAAKVAAEKQAEAERVARLKAVKDARTLEELRQVLIDLIKQSKAVPE